MGWITNRRNKTGFGLAHGVKSARKSAPLMKIISVEMEGDSSLFGSGDLVKLECGHSVFSKGSNKARCLKCKKNVINE